MGAAVVLEDHRRRGVNAGKRRIADRRDPRRHAKHQARERDRVYAKVQQGPAAQFRREQPELRILGEPLPVLGGQVHDIAERSRGEDLTHPRNVRQEARPHRFHEERSLVARGVDHLARLGGVHGERLLDQHGLTRVDREQRGVVMAGVRR